MLIRDRQDAGVRLATALARYKAELPVIVAIPRGGVPVAYEIAASFEAPLEVCIVGKLVVPEFPERGVGAVAEGGGVFVDAPEALRMGVSSEQLGSQLSARRAEVEGRAQRLREGREPVSLAGRTVILVDDGVATGNTAQAAIDAVRTRGAAKVILAVPIAASHPLEVLRDAADEVVCLHETPELYAVGAWYEHFPQLADEDVIATLRRAARREAERAKAARVVERELPVRIAAGLLKVTLLLPPSPRAVVLFVHSTGNSRASLKKRYVSRALNAAGYGSALIELRTDREIALEEEEHTSDIGLLASRLLDVTEALRAEPALRGIPFAYYGTQAGAAAALAAAASCPSWIDVVICRSGRTDLAGSSVLDVHAPTLLIAGGLDVPTLELNRQTLQRLPAIHQLVVVPGASNSFDEPGALDAAASAAVRWLDAALHVPLAAGASH